MSEQTLDLQLVLSTMRRRRRLLTAVTLAGGLAGAVLVHFHPPMYSSTTLVLLPDQSTVGTTGPRDMATETRIVTSDAVLGSARKLARQELSGKGIRTLVTASSPSQNMLQIEARGATAKAAESLANAVAASELAYENDATSSISQAEKAVLDGRLSELQDQLASVDQEVARIKGLLGTKPPQSPEGIAAQAALGRLIAQQSPLKVQIDQVQSQQAAQSPGAQAKVIQQATPAKRPRLLVWTLLSALLFALVAGGLAAILAVALAHRDRRLRTRDEMADALGSPVIGSVKSYRVRNTAAWSLLLESYRPSPTDAWSLRQTLDDVGAAPLLAAASSPGKGAKPRQLTVVLVVPADDPGALAVAGQLASHTASLGVQTRLTARQRHAAADALWATSSRGEDLRPGLRVDPRRRKSSAGLVLELDVVDRQQPVLPDLRQADAIVLVISSGTATEEDLARVAVAAYESGGRFRGIVVADPDTLDHTTGRLLQAQRAVEPPMPMKLTGVDPDEWRGRDGGQP
jgi:capsular polysaccharide biosynthesis protein